MGSEHSEYTILVAKQQEEHSLRANKKRKNKTFRIISQVQGSYIFMRVSDWETVMSCLPEVAAAAETC